MSGAVDGASSCREPARRCSSADEPEWCCIEADPELVGPFAAQHHQLDPLLRTGTGVPVLDDLVEGDALTLFENQLVGSLRARRMATAEPGAAGGTVFQDVEGRLSNGQ